MQEPRLGNLHRGDAERSRDGVHDRGLQWVEAAEGEVRNVGDTLCGEVVNEAVVTAVGEVVKVLDADNLGKGLGLSELLRRHRADADVANKPLLLEFDEHLQRFCNGAGLWRCKSTQAKVDDIEGLKAEVPQIIVDALNQIFTRTVENPGTIVATASANLGNEGEIFRVRMQGFLDDLVGDVRTVEVAGVNVVDAGSDSFAQDRNGFGAITEFAIPAWPTLTI